MNKKEIIWLSVTIIMALVIVIWMFAASSNVTLTDQEIKNKFRCDRVTTDVLETDIYCNNPDLYRQHLRDDIVIQD